MNKIILFFLMSLLAFSFQVVRDEEGRRILLKDDYTWKYIREPKIDDNFKYDEVYFNRIRGTSKSKAYGEVTNFSGKNYKEATFKVMVRNKYYDYVTVGEFTLYNFNNSSTKTFETLINKRYRNNFEYHIKFVDGVLKPKKVKKIKKIRKIDN